jgi:6-phosphofructokinase
MRAVRCWLGMSPALGTCEWSAGSFQFRATKHPRSDSHAGCTRQIHRRGGTILGSSRGGHDLDKIMEKLIEKGVNQVYVIGGDGTHKGANLISKEAARRKIPMSVCGVPKTIDNDVPFIDKSFGFDTAVQEAVRVIQCAVIEAEDSMQGMAIVKLMGRECGFVAMYATLATNDVDICLIPEAKFDLDILFEYCHKVIAEKGHCVLVVAEGAGQDHFQGIDLGTDPSGNKRLPDIGVFLKEQAKLWMQTHDKPHVEVRYIDPSYQVRPAAPPRRRRHRARALCSSSSASLQGLVRGPSPARGAPAGAVDPRNGGGQRVLHDPRRRHCAWRHGRHDRHVRRPSLRALRATPPPVPPRAVLWEKSRSAAARPPAPAPSETPRARGRYTFRSMRCAILSVRSACARAPAQRTSRGRRREAQRHAAPAGGCSHGAARLGLAYEAHTRRCARTGARGHDEPRIQPHAPAHRPAGPGPGERGVGGARAGSVVRCEGLAGPCRGRWRKGPVLWEPFCWSRARLN